jgi:hypothetical protein
MAWCRQIKQQKETSENELGQLALGSALQLQ